MDLISAGAKFLEISAKVGENLSTFASDPELDKRLQRIVTNLGPYGVDPFGFDPQYMGRVIAPLAWVYRHYFRVQTVGIENIPDGRCLVIANHSGQLPYDSAMISTAIFLEREPPRLVRAMVERFTVSTPFVSPFLARCGQILGTPENCRRLLQAEDIIQIFPEGVAGLNKTWNKRYQLQRFGQGFMRLAMEQKTPIVPAVVIGAEEQAPSFANLKNVGKFFGLPAFPLTVAPFCGLLPLPARYRIYFGPPMYVRGDANDEDDVIVAKVAEVRAVMQDMLDRGLAARERVFW